MKSSLNTHFQSRLFASFAAVCLLFQAGFTTPVLASSQPATSAGAVQAAPAKVVHPSPARVAPPFVSCAAVTEIPSAECDALAAVYNLTNGPSWSNDSNWLQTATPCSWYGVTCTVDGVIPTLYHVTTLSLGSNHLFGPVPSELSGLTYLEYLYLSHNQLGGSIPSSLGSLVKLKELELDSNGLTGSIPSSLGSLTLLTSLYLDENQLSGSIPTTLGSLTSLITLSLYENQLSGSIPTTLGSLTNLTVLDLDTNQLTGSIPTELGSLVNLTNLYLYDNQLSGSIPTSLGSLAAVQYLDLSYNQLTGSIPSSLGSLTNVIDLYLNHNKLSGALPTTFIGGGANLNSLGDIKFDCWITSPDSAGNPVTDFIAGFLGSGWELNRCAQFTSCAAVTKISTTECDALTALYTSTDGAGSWKFNDNWLQIDNPCTWYGVTCSGGHVTQLNLSYNQLHGTLPTALGNLTSLTHLILRGNYGNLTGSIPASLGSLTNLIYLDLYNNHLSGSIPASLGSLSKLRILYLDSNYLTGSIPTELGNLTNLFELDLAENNLSGSIPASLGNLANLTYLNLYYNFLTGNLPELGGMTSLTYLNVSYNYLSGEIPASITGLGSASATSSTSASGFHAHSKQHEKFMRANNDLSAQSGALQVLYLSCGLTSSNPAVIAYVENLSPGWMDYRCVTTITTDTPDPSSLGQAVTVTVTVGGGLWIPFGTVHITGADTTCDATLFNGTGSCSVIFNTSGAKTLTATYTDDDQDEGSTDTETHAIKMERALNGGFNTYIGTSKIPKSWKAVKFAPTDGKNVKIKKEGSASVMIAGTGKTKTLSQTLTLSGLAGDVFALSYWVKGSALPAAGTCQVQVKLFNGAAPAGVKTVKCPAATFTWKKLTGNLTATSAYTKAVITITYSKASGTVWFDGLSLIK